MGRSVDYFFAPQSPWTYLGHERFVRLVREQGAQVRVRPVDLGRVFAVSGGLPLSQRPVQRQAYRLVELARFARHLSLPLHPQPKFFPVAGDPGAKLIIAALHAGGTDKALALAGALGSAVWAEEKNVADADTLIATANSIGLDGAALLQATDSDAVNADYARNTEEAIEAKVFGVPWYRVDGEGFWGQDRLDFVERLLSA